MLFFIKTIAAALLISFCSWLSARKPQLAGFMVALPLTSVIVLLFSYLEHRNDAQSIEFAKSIFIGVPVSFLFFIPFLLANRWQWSFLAALFAGLCFLMVGYFVHKNIFDLLS